MCVRIYNIFNFYFPLLVLDKSVLLQEEILRLRHASGASQGMPAPITTKYSPAVQAQPFPMIYLVGAVAIAIFGIILGKFIL